MKRKLFIIVAMLLGGVSLNAHQIVNLHLGYSDDTTMGPGHPKTPPYTPVVEQTENLLTFESSHAEFTLDIIQNGEVIYTVSVPEEATTITLPSWIEGECELRLSTGSSYYFYGTIVL